MNKNNKNNKNNQNNIKNIFNLYQSINNNNNNITNNNNNHNEINKMKEPKGFVSGFNFFAQRVRSTMSSEFKNLSNNEINKVVGQLWKKLPVSERIHFLNRGEEDKLRYLQEVHIYNLCNGGNLIPKIDPPPGYGLDGKPLPSVLNCTINTTTTTSIAIEPTSGSLLSNEGLKQTNINLISIHRKRGRKKKEIVDNEAQAAIVATKLARKRTAYSVFAHQERTYLEGLKIENMQKGLGKYLSHRWKVMDASEKQLYEAIAIESGNSKTIITSRN